MSRSATAGEAESVTAHEVINNTAIKIFNSEEVEDFIDAGTVVIDTENVDEYADESLDFATMVK